MYSSPLENVSYDLKFTSLFWMVCEIGCKWPYNCCFVGCCFQFVFKTVEKTVCSSNLVSLDYFNRLFFFCKFLAIRYCTLDTISFIN